MATHAGMFVPLDSAGNGMSALDARLALGGLIGTTQRCVSGGTMTQSSSNMQVGVNGSVFALADLDNAGAMCLTPFDGTLVTLAAGSGAAGSRIDSIIVRQQIPGNSLGDTATPGLISVAQGTPSTGTPGNPTIPAGWFEYARVTVPASATTANACTVQILNPSQPAPPALTAANAAALVPVAGQYVGQYAYGADGVTYRWSAAGWRAWESDWTAYTPSISGIAGSYGAAPGWQFTYAEWRWSGGKIKSRGVVYLNGGTAAVNGQIAIGMPTAAAQRNSATPISIGEVKGGHSGNGYELVHFLGGTTTPSIYISYLTTNGATAATAATAPFTWVQSDTVAWNVEYDGF